MIDVGNGMTMTLRWFALIVDQVKVILEQTLEDTKVCIRSKYKGRLSLLGYFYERGL